MTQILTERADGVCVLTMNRPEKRNALSLEMMTELTQALLEVEKQADVGAVVLRGEGPAFSAGHDLRELQCRDEASYREIFAACTRLMQTVHRIPQPVIAEVATVATAAGCQLVATCDLAVASTQARFATPGVRIGLFCTTPMVALSRAVGRKRAMEMLLTGDFIDAQTAADWGLVNRVVAPERLHDEAMTLARKVLEASATVVAIGKRAFYEQIDRGEGAAYEYAGSVMTANALLPDAQEGMSAFTGKRAPRWTPREAERGPA